MLTTIVFFFALIYSISLIIGIVIALSQDLKLNKSFVFLLIIGVSILWSILFYLLN